MFTTKFHPEEVMPGRGQLFIIAKTKDLRP